jgi:hypothetical protein
MPYYEMKSGSGHKEGDKLLPDSARGRWWHEMLRGVSSLENLNVVIIRVAAEYGRGTLGGQVVPRVVVGMLCEPYRSKNRPRLPVSVGREETGLTTETKT